ncbi:hypothetical protein AU255_11795 [Methyloprofundus sedimenti]|uniref:DUF2914 domain-containing protein n=1 Tax=Methyloprofundus sedimenti TaxID=1420851 RepID=A0A1V8MA31_9GAMM|nr:DUF2914 domain-containing protein [Methyloprofundus sedimenti]OQK18464.1 hypothetical protein AU255_11795 [Methyloprofundus sedimenti]
MKADKTISIKVKSKTEQRIMEDPELEMISVWNFKKILYALIVLILLVMLPAYYFSSLNDSETEKPPSEENEFVTNHVDSVKETAINKPAIENSSNITLANKAQVDVVNDVQQTPVKETIAQQHRVDSSATDDASEKIAKQAIQKEVVIANVQKIPTNNIEEFNPNITRAQFAQGVNKLEPFGEIELPILVDKSKAKSVTYFTEVKNMQGKTVFHEWLKDGKSIYKRKINIRGDRWRVSTSKLFPYNSIGQWQVRIINQQGDILHKIDFSVEKSK